MKIQDFLRRVWGEQEGWAFVAWSDHQGAFPQKPYKYPGDLGLLLRDIERYNNWASVYFGVHLYTKKDRRIKQNAKPVTCLWLDLDKGNPRKIKPKPTLCWSTSSDRYQAVWVLDKPADPRMAEEINRHLTYANGGDKGKWALTTYLRIPLTDNFKHTPPYKGHFLWTDGPVYSIEDLRPPKDVALEQTIEIAEDSTIPDKLPAIQDVYRQYGSKFSPVLWSILNATPTAKDDWSEKLWQLARLLLEVGVPIEAAFVICKHSNWNKYARDGRPDSHLWRDLLKAKGEAGKETASTGLPWVGIDTLMTYTRKPEWLVEDIWMQANVGWIAGVGKSYKSTLSLDLALSIASGTPFLGQYKVVKPGPVLMVQEEDPVWRVARRLQAMARRKDLTPIQLSRDMYGITLTVEKDKPIPLISCVSGGCVLTDPQKLVEVEMAIAKYKPCFVLLDPWYQMAAGLDEFKAGDVTELLFQIKQWRNKYDCAIGIVHHYRKGNSGDGRDRLYGSMAFYAWAENSLFVSRKPDGNVVEIQRDIKDAKNIRPFAVEFHEIDDDYDFTVYNTMDQKKATSEDKLLSFLLSQEVGDKIGRNELAAATGFTPKTISARLKEMAEQHLVKLTYEGQGGQMHATILPTLFKGGTGFDL
jgi:hypothetical protein